MKKGTGLVQSVLFWTLVLGVVLGGWGQHPYQLSWSEAQAQVAQGAESCQSQELVPASEEEAHQAITHDLFHGKIVSAVPFGANNNNTKIFKVLVYNPLSSRWREALLKPREYGDNDGWGRTPMEYVAYEMNRLLGMDNVPPVAYRHWNRSGGLVLNGQRIDEGALLYMVPDAHSLHKVAVANWDSGKVGSEKDKQLFLSDTRILDVLLQNPDRHINNFLRGRHWVDGVYRPLLIDHAASLRKQTNTRLEDNDAYNSGSVQVVRKKTWQALKKLDESSMRKLAGFVSAQEVQQILQRRDRIVSYFASLIKDRGEENVILGD